MMSHNTLEHLDLFASEPISGSQVLTETAGLPVEVVEILGDMEKGDFLRALTEPSGTIRRDGRQCRILDARQKPDPSEWDLLLVQHGTEQFWVAVDSDVRCLWISVKGIENVPTMIAEMSSNSLKRLRVHRSNLSIHLNFDTLESAMDAIGF